MASLEELRSERLRKLEALKKEGFNPYPIESRFDATLSDAIKNFNKLSKKKSIFLVGRVLSIRGQGGLSFVDIHDGTAKFQMMLKRDSIGELYDRFIQFVDIGDFVEVNGKLFITKRKEKSIEAKEWKMLSKSLRPLPDKWHGLQDIEERFRKRYLDLLMSEGARERFVLRSKMISAVRDFLEKNGYMEVETPMLQPLAGGATAAPFVTHHNALDADLFLRIAPELYLKKLLVGGFNKVYELNRNFRNEGIDPTHNPEFTMLEFYESYSTGDKQRAFVEDLFRSVVKKVTGGFVLEHGEEKIDFKKKFEVVPFLDLIKRYALIPDPLRATRDEVALVAKQMGISVEPKDAKEKILDNIYKKACRPKLIQPTFIIDYPLAFSPFAKKKEDNPELIDRFQLVAGSIELVNAFSELNDPIDQLERYVEQDKKRGKGEVEVSPSDQDYIEALEHGMPPAGGVGVGIDRFAMLLTNTENIKEVIIFPTLKPKNG